jgi:cystathionine beta-lyase
MFDFDREIDRHATNSMKWDRYAGSDILPMWVADMDFQAPPAVVAAVRATADHGVFGYAGKGASATAAVQEMLAQRFAWQVEADWIVWLPGVVCGLNLACRLGDRSPVLVQTPVYPPFLAAPALAGRSCRKLPLSCIDGHWQVDWDAVETAAAAAGLLLLCNPHNPVGRVFTRAELERLAAICCRHDVVVCADEIHCDLVYKPHTHIPIAALSPEIAARTVTLMAPSKTYNIPGIGIGFAVIPDRGMRRAFRAAARGIVPDVGYISYAACEAAYREGGAWLAALLTYLRNNRDRVAAVIEDLPGLSASTVEGTYLTWIDVRQTGLPQPAAHFESHGLGLSDGAGFALPGYLRLNFGCPRATLERGLERLRRAVASLPQTPS